MASPPPGFGQPVQLPGAGMQPLGGGPVLQKPKPPLDPQNDMGMMGPRFAGPMPAQPMPGGGGMMHAGGTPGFDFRGTGPTADSTAGRFAQSVGMVANLNSGSPMPMPQPTKPSPGRPLPAMDAPQINAPQNPGYFPMQPGVREIQGPSFGFGRAAPQPAFTGAPEYSAQQGRVGQIQPGFSPSQFSAQQISANYTPQGGPQIGELPQASYSPQAVSAGPVNA